LRAYALDRLVVAGEEERARQMHQCYLEHLARDSDLERLDAGVEKRFQRLQAELPNLRTGIDWAITHDQAAALRILAALGPFWMDADLASEGCDLHLRVLSTSAAPGSPVQTRVLGQVACLYAYTGEFAAAAPWVDAALALAHDRDDEWAIAHVLITQNGIAMSQGDGQRARVLLEEAMARFQALDDSWGIFAALNELGIAAMDSGDHEAALGYFTRLRAFAEERGLTGSYRAQVLVNLADACRLLGAFGEVEGLCTEILAMPDLTRPSIVAIAQQNLGYVCLHRGEVSRAADLIRQSLDVFWQIGDWWNVAPLLESAALVMHVHGDSAPSVRSFAAASTLREAMPYPLSAVLQDDVDKHLLASRAALGDAAYAAAWATGTTERLDAAVIFARNTLLELCDARDSRQVSEG
jgi:tetratricopeptide (TPR) repeat protein